ncbi:hypothetical protein ACFL5Z_05970, partial [Planctomycetota bacterium]
ECGSLKDATILCYKFISMTFWLRLSEAKPRWVNSWLVLSDFHAFSPNLFVPDLDNAYNKQRHP